MPPAAAILPALPATTTATITEITTADAHGSAGSTFALVALLAVANWIHHRSAKVPAGVGAPERAKDSVLVD